MAKISKVSAQKRAGRYNIFLDGHYAFSASENTLAKFVLLPGKELNDKQVAQIKQADSASRAEDLAARYLSYQPRSVFEVESYLLKKGLPAAAVNSAITQLTDLGYLDDAKYAGLVIKDSLQVGTNGPGKLRLKLKQKGVAPDVTDLALAEVATADWQNMATRILRPLVSQKGRLSQRQLVNKARQRLYSHGFSGDLAAELLTQVDLRQDESLQEAALQKQGAKAWRRYSRYDGHTRRQKVRAALFRQGFASGEISSFLDSKQDE